MSSGFHNYSTASQCRSTRDWWKCLGICL